MANKTGIRYIVVNTRTNKPVAMDMPSGGYPYDVDDLWKAKFFETPEGAWNWAKIVWALGPYTVMSLHLSLNVVVNNPHG